jgi:hypothetical protein
MNRVCDLPPEIDLLPEIDLPPEIDLLSETDLPPEIWNSIVYFSQDNNLIKFLIYYQTRNIRIDKMFLKKIYNRNTQQIRESEQLQNYYAYLYSSNYQSMYSTNISWVGSLVAHPW